MNNIGVILAAGNGKRIDDSRAYPKQFRELRGKKILSYSLECFNSCEAVDRLCVVAGEEWMDHTAEVVSQSALDKPVDIVAGGSERHYSCLNAVKQYHACDGTGTNLLFHDAARPLVSASLLLAVCGALKENSAVSPIIPCTDTVWRIDGECGTLSSPLNREELGCAQTPQGFRLELLRSAYARHGECADLPLPTDTCGLIRKTHPSIPIIYIKGEIGNIKITYNIDFFIAESFLEFNT